MKLTALFISLALLSGCAGIMPRYHVVEAGETLGKIAALYQIPVNAVREANNEVAMVSLKPGVKVYLPFEQSAAWDQTPVPLERIPSGSPDAMPAGISAANVSFLWPVHGYVSSQFGWRKDRHHEGIDIPARKGTPVKTARSGHVIYAGNGIAGYGNLVIVRHADTYSTVYAHLSEIVVKKGQFLTRGQRLGRVGNTGHSRGPHLHFEIRNNRIAVDPMLYLPGQFAKNS